MTKAKKPAGEGEQTPNTVTLSAEEYAQFKKLLSKEAQKEATAAEQSGGKVSVEMTKDQANKFADFILKEQEDKEQHDVNARYEDIQRGNYRIDLRFTHHINGVRYLKGQHMVSKDIARTLAYQEQQAFQSFMKQFTGNKVLLEIASSGGGARVVKVEQLQQGATA